MPSLPGIPVSGKPLDYGTGGVFRLSRRLVPAASQTGILWVFRNAHATRLAVVDRIKLQLLQVAAPTAAIEARFSVIRAFSYTVIDGTGITAITPAANEQKLRSTSANAVTAVLEANVAAGASGGTRTVDTNPIASGAVWVPAALQTASIQAPTPVIDYHPVAGLHPLVCGTNEGFFIRSDVTLGATTGVVLLLDLQWTEVDTF